jgi:cell fate regulator YaaT (PSP1 superfamily)
MEQTTRPYVVGVRFSKVGKIYHFSADNAADVKVGDMVVVETSRGWQLGQVSQLLENADPPPDGWKAIDRRATPRDLLLRQMWQMKEADVVTACRTKASDLRLSGIKIVSAEYSFDGSRLMILFSTETEEKYDLKSLRQDMQKLYAPSQVEMRQVGPRDVAKVHCGMGACGLETRCCCLFLTEFSSISIRMAKEQGISLTPTEITGMCGRLRCCLIYEYDTYVDARAKLPKRNKRVRTPEGEGKVVDVVPLRGAVIVEIPEVGHKEFPADQVVSAEDGVLPPLEGSIQVNTQASEVDQAITGIESKETTTKPTHFQNRPAESPTPQPPQSSNFPPRRQDRRNRGPAPKSQGPNPPESRPAGSSPEKSSQPDQKRGPEQRWKKKPKDAGSQPQAGGGNPNRPKNQPGGGAQPQPPQANKDNPRRKGPRRDNSDTQD